MSLVGTLGAMYLFGSAAVLGCSDARVPIELIFNEGPNECSAAADGSGILADAATTSRNKLSAWAS
jgi:hypothetical protein